MSRKAGRRRLSAGAKIRSPTTKEAAEAIRSIEKTGVPIAQILGVESLGEAELRSIQIRRLIWFLSRAIAADPKLSDPQYISACGKS